MKLNIAICDDEKNQIKYVKDIVSEWAETKGHMSILAEFPSALKDSIDVERINTFGHRVSGHGIS